MSTSPFTNANFGNLAAQVAHDPSGAARLLRDLEAEVERLRSELREAHNWLLAAEMCDCEYFEGAGHYRCRFAEALSLDAPSNPSSSGVSGVPQPEQPA